MIQVATEGGLILSTTNRWQILVRNLGFKIASSSKKIALSNVRRSTQVEPYKNGLIGKQHAVSGARFFPPRVQTAEGKAALMDEMVTGRFALISHKPVSGEAVDWFQSVLGGVSLVVGEEFQDPDNNFTRYFTTNKAHVLLIRPDYYIFDAGSEANLLCSALREQLKQKRS